MFIKTSSLPVEDKHIVMAIGTVCQELFRKNGKAPTVIRGYVNRVTKPATDDYILITPMSHVRLSKNRTHWDGETSVKDITVPTRRRVQIDCCGSKADVWAKTLFACFEDISIVDMMAEYNVVPLWAEAPQDLTDADDNEQYHPRYMLELQVQVNPTTSVELQSATEAIIQVKVANSNPKEAQ